MKHSFPLGHPRAPIARTPLPALEDLAGLGQRALATPIASALSPSARAPRAYPPPQACALAQMTPPHARTPQVPAPPMRALASRVPPPHARTPQVSAQRAFVPGAPPACVRPPPADAPSPACSAVLLSAGALPVSPSRPRPLARPSHSRPSCTCHERRADVSSPTCEAEPRLRSRMFHVKHLFLISFRASSAARLSCAVAPALSHASSP